MNRHCKATKSKQWIYLLLVSVMITAISSAYAQFGGGNGSAANPWQISRPEHLDHIRNYLGEEHTNRYYLQTANINLDTAPWNEGQGWVPIGSSITDSFRGNYDGGKTIKKSRTDYTDSTD